jgi:hypothetical protein
LQLRRGRFSDKTTRRFHFSSTLVVPLDPQIELQYHDLYDSYDLSLVAVTSVRL